MKNIININKIKQPKNKRSIADIQKNMQKLEKTFSKNKKIKK